MNFLQIAGLAVFIVGMASIAIRLLFWAIDIDSIFFSSDDEA